MANLEHVQRLRAGVSAWNEWREENPDIIPDLTDADLSGSQLGGTLRTEVYDYFPKAYLRASGLRLANFCEDPGANLKNAKLHGATLTGADLRMADFTLADLEGANLSGADLTGAFLYWTLLLSADLRRAKLAEALMVKADLTGADLTGADLTDADLSYACLAHANLCAAVLEGCEVFGTSAWDVKTSADTTQRNLRVSTLGRSSASAITVDNLEVAQLIFVLLDNERIRQVIDTIVSKVVLILGRFTPERKPLLDALRQELRSRGYTPVLFDFEAPDSRGVTETVATLAHLARFIIADITEARSIPQELMLVVPHLPSVPVQPILLDSQDEYGMFEHFKHYPWVLDTFRYKDLDDVLLRLADKVVGPAEARVREQGGGHP